MLINRVRGVLAEFGLMFRQSPQALRRVLADVMKDASDELTGIARLVVQRAHLHWIDLDRQIKWRDKCLKAHARIDDRAARLPHCRGSGCGASRRSRTRSE